MHNALANDFITAFNLIDNDEKTKNEKLVSITIEILDRLFEFGDQRKDTVKIKKDNSKNEK